MLKELIQLIIYSINIENIVFLGTMRVKTNVNNAQCKLSSYLQSPFILVLICKSQFTVCQGMLVHILIDGGTLSVFYRLTWKHVLSKLYPAQMLTVKRQ